MSEPKIKNSNLTQSQRLLCCAKLAAVALSFLFAFPHLPAMGKPELNFVSTFFYIAMIGLIPSFGWVIPSLTLGFWLTPMIFAFRVNGSFAEDLTAAIAGGIIGIMVGATLDILMHRKARIADLDMNVPPPGAASDE